MPVQLLPSVRFGKCDYKKAKFHKLPEIKRIYDGVEAKKGNLRQVFRFVEASAPSLIIFLTHLLKDFDSE